MEELRTRQPISWLDDVDADGVVVNPQHELYGKRLAGTTLHFPGASGSTVGSDRIVNLAVRGLAPTKIILERVDPITMWGAILGKIDIEVAGARRTTVDPRTLEDRGVDPEIAGYLAHAGELLGSNDFIPVDHVQIAGVSYKTITETGLELRRYLGGKYRFRAKNVTINPAGMDLENWRALGIPEEFARKQREVIDIYVRMGARPTITCTPYLIGSMPPPFTDAFLSESSVVAYANSVLGVRTNRESGLSTLLYAIAGWGPRYGMHLPEHRNPTLRVEVSCDIHGSVDFGLLGYRLGELAHGQVPYLTGIPPGPSLEELKALSAAGAASGSVDLYHIEGVTAEVRAGKVSFGSIGETVSVDRKSLDEVKRTLNTGSVDELDLVTFGCPHASLEEVKEIALLLEGKRVRAGVALWVCTSRAVKELASRNGLVATIEAAGGNVVADTCMVVAPIESMGPKTTATNSGKAAKYLPRFCHQRVVFDSAEQIIGRITV
ncbi:MAG TPA: aconitase X [Thermoplasmata archaeon]|nr:aconitase X [Thermoplasmata archaeon]